MSHDNYDDCCIVCLGIGKWCPRGVDRLAKSLDDVGYTGGRMFWRDDWPTDIPTHKEVPYGFKPYCMAKAADAGYRKIVWLDASHWPVRPVEPLFERIAQDGAYFVYDGWNVYQWCHDEALVTLKIEREQAFGIPLLWAGIIGLDMRAQRCRDFLGEWLVLSRDGVTFQGPWTNKDGECSKDPCVLGHRHDQTAASVLAWRHHMPGDAMGLSLVDTNWEDPRDGVMFLATGSA